jgi:dTDP-4-amino-4,6-dideoxy-D-galactose acyltransferase
VNPPCEFLTWDTDFFGVRIARVVDHRLESPQMNAILDWCRANEIGCLYLLADSNHAGTVTLAENAGFRFVDIRLTFRHKSSQHTVTASELIHMRPARPDDLPVLQDMARKGFRDTRFYYDPCFPTERCDALYETWITRSCQEKGFADTVIVADFDSRPIGHITCRLSGDKLHGQIGLVGVAASAQGRGVGRQLIKEALDWFAQQGAEVVDVVTQGRNVPAQRLYQSAGFVTHAAQLWYHKWFIDCD